MVNIDDVLQMAIAFFTICFVVKASLDYFTRKKLIDKGLVDKNVKYLFKYGSPALSSLKWGMVLVGIGAAVIIGKLVPYRWSDEITISGMFILAGLALIIYYFIAPKASNGNADDTPSERRVD